MKHMKRAASLVLALIMVLCIAIPAYAVNTDSNPNSNEHKITIDGATDADKGKYEAYQIFRGDITDGKLTNITWGNGVTPCDQLTYALSNHAVIGQEMQAAIAGAEEKNLTEAEAVASVVATYSNDSAKLDAFAEVIGNYLNGEEKYTNSTNAGTIKVTGDGYYLLQMNQPSDGAYTKYILSVVEDTSVTAKKDAPTLDKFIVDGETSKKETSASVGDVIEFMLRSNVPEMDGYDKYYYIIHDTLSKGLTYNGLETVKVKIGEKTLTAYDPEENNTDYDYVVNVDGQKIEIVFCNFLENYKEYAGAAIVVTYSATLNEKAVITDEGNPNTAWLQYSNDPNYDHDGDSDPSSPSTPPEDPDTPDGPDKPVDGQPTGKTPNKTVKVYTTALQINKVGEDGQTALTGAKFKIDGTRSDVFEINKEIYEENAAGEYYRLKDGSYTKEAPTEGTADLYDGNVKYAKITVVEQSTSSKEELVAEGWVNANGVITFTKLGEGTYTITELIAPAGYNLLKEPIDVTITFNGTADEGALWTVDVASKGIDGENDPIEAILDNNVYSINVANQAGVTLPSTGGMGTTIFYIVGGLMVLAATVLLVTKRRMNVAA